MHIPEKVLPRHAYQGVYTMDIIISNASGEPIYNQIADQIKTMILEGKLKEGDALPSMRNLALQLRISVITTKRAYEELERDGFIESYTGKGSFVKAQNEELYREEQLKAIEGMLTDAAEKARRCGITLSEMIEMLELLYGGEDHD
jgi:GntR family transcriptional regulator